MRKKEKSEKFKFKKIKEIIKIKITNNRGDGIQQEKTKPKSRWKDPRSPEGEEDKKKK